MIKTYLRKMKRTLKRSARPSDWSNLRSLQPVSRYFGFDRGTPVDRYYIEKFLQSNRSLVRGSILEVGGDEYSKKFASNIETIDVIAPSRLNDRVTIIADLGRSETVPSNRYDCFICTQTLNFIYDFKEAIKSAHRLLKTGGVVLATVAGISQISRYDMDRWGDFWKFTEIGIGRPFKEVFGDTAVETNVNGNVLAAVAFLEGISAEELTQDELDFLDMDYQMLITVKARKEVS